MNPAEGLTKTTQNMFHGANRSMLARMEGLIRFLNDGRVHDAIIKSLDADSTDKCVVDIYEGGFGQAPTRLDYKAFIIDNWEEYMVGWPAKVILKDGHAYIVSGVYAFYLKPSAYDANKITGKPSDETGTADAAITVSININLAFPFESTSSEMSYQDADVLLWIRYPRPYDCGDFDSAGVLIFGVSGSGLPPGTGRYKVLMLNDDLDPGTPVWDFERFD